MLVSLLLFTCQAAVGSDFEGYVIGSVLFDIRGKSLETVIRKELGLEPYAEIFPDEKTLKGRIEERRRYLFNKRIFEEVMAAAVPIGESGGLMIYEVTYEIIDGNTTLLLPVIKYDSNYGGKLGFKLYDTNLFGLLTDFRLDAGLRQIAPDSIEDFELVADLNVTRMKLFDHQFDLGTYLEIDAIGGALQNGRFIGTADLYEIEAGSTVIDAFTSISLTQYQAGSVGLWANPIIDAGFTWRRIPVPGERLLTWNSAFKYQKEGLSWELPQLTVTNRLSTRLVTIDSQPYHGFLKHLFGYDTALEKVLAHAIDLGVSSIWPFGNGWKYGGEITFRTRHISSPFELIQAATRHTLTHGTVDWVDNFREGSELKLTLSTLMPISEGSEELIRSFSIAAVLEGSWFTLLSDSLNFSLRGAGFAAGGRSNLNPIHPGEYMRGILDAGLPQNAGFFGLTFNTNLNLNLFDFTVYIWDRSPDGKFYISPFFDFSVFQAEPLCSGIGPAWIESSGGLEIYVIFDSFRSFPLSATFGVNLRDLASWMGGAMDFGNVEREIIIALGMFY